MEPRKPSQSPHLLPPPPPFAISCLEVFLFGITSIGHLREPFHSDCESQMPIGTTPSFKHHLNSRREPCEDTHVRCSVSPGTVHMLYRLIESPGLTAPVLDVRSLKHIGGPGQSGVCVTCQGTDRSGTVCGNRPCALLRSTLRTF